MHSHTGCICLAFLQCVFSNVSWKCLPKKRQSHMGCICWTFPHCAFSSVSLNRLSKRTYSYTGCICLTSHLCHFLSFSLELQYLNWFCSNHSCHDFDPTTKNQERGREGCLIWALLMSSWYWFFQIKIGQAKKFFCLRFGIIEPFFSCTEMKVKVSHIVKPKAAEQWIFFQNKIR